MLRTNSNIIFVFPSTETRGHLDPHTSKTGVAEADEAPVFSPVVKILTFYFVKHHRFRPAESVCKCNTCIMMTLTLTHSVSAACQNNGNVQICTYTGVDTIPRNIDPSITRLMLNDNIVTSITQSDFVGLTGIRFLNLGGNLVEELEDNVFSEMPQISSISLRSNNIHTVSPDALNGVPNLALLNLADNQIQSIPPDFFDHTPLLHILTLSKNLITNLDPGLFQQVTNLEKILLDRNPLGSIPSDLLNNMASLELLSLMRTGLSNIPVDLFDDCVNLKSIDLRGNNLESLSAAHFQNIPRTPQDPLVLELGDNPLLCCTMLGAKDEEAAGTIIWFSSPGWNKSPPECVDVDWALVSAANCL